jgi:spore germination protein YaaH
LRRIVSLSLSLLTATVLLASTAKAGAPPAGAGTPGGQPSFSDIADNWAAAYITELLRSGVLTVPADGLFRPSEPVTRLDFAVWMARAQELSPQNTAPAFSDWDQVPGADQGLVAAAVRAGYLKGYPDGTLRPLQTITRLEMAVVFGRVLQGYGEQPNPYYFQAFVDGASIPAWGAPASLPLADGIMYGEPATPEAAIAPQQATTRAETVTLIVRYLEYRTAHYHVAPLPAAPAPAAFLVGAWDSNSDTAYQVLQAHGSVLNWLIYTGYNAEPDGTLQGYDSPRTLQWVRANPMPLLVMVQNDWSDDSFLHNPAAEQRFRDQLLTVLQRSNYAGVNIDFEGIAGADGPAFTSFIAMLSQALHAQHYLLTVDTPSETAANTQAPWAAAYDYPALAPLVDDLILMAYDYHYPGSSPGPVGPIDWIRQVLAYTTSVVPARKVILGLPAYGYLWGNNGKTAAYWEVGMENQANANHATIFHNDQAQEGTFTYTDSAGVAWVGWFLDPAGLAQRLALAHQDGLGGVIFWRLDYDAPDWWPVLAGH